MSHWPMKDGTTVMSWDWRAQPDLAVLDQAVRRLTDGRVAVTEVDTGGDEYAIVVGPPMTKDEAVAAWKAIWE